MAQGTKKQRRAKRKFRNRWAVAAHFKTGAGSHGDARKEASKKACRTKVRY